MEKQLTQKLMAIVVLLVLCVSGHAQTKKVIIEDDKMYSGIRMTPKEFSVDNVPSLYVFSYGADEAKINIYDDNLGVKKSITPQIPGVNYYTIRKYLEPIRVVSKEDDGDEVQESYEVLTAESAEKFLTEERGIAIREKKETAEAVFFYLNEEYWYFRYEDYAYQYPTEYFKWDKATSYLYRCMNIRYSVQTTYSTTWKEEREDQVLYPSLINLDLDLLHQEGSSHLTQTLFNTDAAYEYLLPVYTVETVVEYEGQAGYDEVKGEDVVIEKFSGTQPRLTGVKVVNDAGATVTTISFDSNFSMYSGSSISPDVFDLGGKKYLAFNGYIQKSADESVSAIVIYSIDSETSAVRQVAMETGMRVNPTIAHRSDMITVSLEGDSNKVRKVRVVNAAGKTVKVVNVPAGQRSIQLHANELSNGLNIVNVEGEAANTCKVIVR